MADPIIINPTMTLAGQAAAFNASDDGFELKITAVSYGRAHYNPTGNELALVDPVGSKIPLAGGSRPTPYQLRMVSSWREDVGEVPIGEVGFWAGDVLAFVWSKADGTRAGFKTNGVAYVLFNDLAFAQVPANSISFEIDPSESVALAALAAHEGALNAHPQYLLRADVAKDSGPLSWLGLAGGTANVLVLSLDAPESELPALAPGQRFQFLATQTNTLPVTANVEGHGPIAVKRGGDAGLVDLDPGDIKAGSLYDLNYDGTYWQLGGGVGSGKAFERFSFVAGVAQSQFTAAHTPGSIIVLRNGREIRNFTSAVDGSKVTLGIPCNVDDSVEILSFKSFKVADTFTKAEITALLTTAGGLPVGSMLPMPKGIVPPGYLEVDGSVQSIAVYPDLAAYLGTTFNTGGEGAGNFRLPESRGEFFRGWDHGRGVDAARAIGSTQLDQMQRITGHLGAINGGTTFGNGTGALKKTGANIQSHTSSGGGAYPQDLDFDSADSPGARTGGETRSRNLAVMWCIKAWNAPINQGNIDIAALAAQVAVATPQDHLSGFWLVMNGAAPATTVDVGPGAARSLGNPVFSSVTISGVLQAAGAWSAGTGGNKLDTGIRAVSAWYHVFALRRIAGGEADVLFSLSLTGPQVPAGYELIYRIGSLGTDASGFIRPFLMDVVRGRRRFRWVTPILDVNEASLSTAAISYKLSVPTGIAVDAEMNTFAWANNAMVYFSALDTADLAPANSAALSGFTCGYGTVTDSATDSSGAQLSIKTNANAQIRARANVAVKVSVLTLGWEE